MSNVLDLTPVTPANHLRLFSLVRSGKEHRGVDLISDGPAMRSLVVRRAGCDYQYSRLRKVLQPARIASLSSLISWAMSSGLASLPLLGKERLLFLLGTNHFLD